MSAPWINPAFVAGEIAPALFGHVDLAKLHVAASTMRNMFVNYKGGAYSRGGTAFVARSKQPGTSSPPRLIAFKFSITQSFCLEFGNQYMRVFSNGAPVVEAPFNISAATKANPCQITATGNNFATGDWVTISGVGGMTQLNGKTFIATVVSSGSTFTLADLNGNPINSSAYGTYTSGGTVSRIYTLATPWLDSDLFALKFAQSADVMSLVHPSYPPYDLARVSDTNWTVTATTFSSPISAPSNCTATATVNPSGTSSPPTLPAAYAYMVTAVDTVTGAESVGSPRANVTNSVDMAVTAGSIIIDWSTVSGASSYNIYRAPTSYNTDPGDTTNALPVPDGAPFGYIGTAFGSQFVDSNIVPDFSQVPPLHTNPFAPGRVLQINITAGGSAYTSASVSITSGTGSGFVGGPIIVGGAIVAVYIKDAGQGYLGTDTVVFSGTGTGATGTLSVGPQTGTYPGCVSYFQERRVYASSLNNPDTYWMSQPGAFQNFDSGIPVNDADAITGTPWSQQVNGIQSLVAMPGGLVTFTGLGAWNVVGSGGSALNPVAITPASQQAIPASFVGCAQYIAPITINYDILFVQSKGSEVRDLNYNLYFNFYTASDLTQLSSHLFLGYTINDWAWCEEPYKLLWAVRSDHSLLSLTYLKEQEVYGWARHDTLGLVYSVCSVIEPPVDALYLATARFPQDGVGFHYYIERMDDRIWNQVESTWCVDCGLSLPLTVPDVGLSVSGISGTCTFTTFASVFSPSSVGQVIRVAGGIATVASYISATAVTATYTKPATQFLPGSTLVFANAGEWSISPLVTTVSGLDHLVGLAVTGLADGVLIPPVAVPSNGTITLPQPSSTAVVGLAFTAQLQTVYADPATQPTPQGRRKDITAATARIEASAWISAGTNQPDGSVQSPPVLETTPWAVTPIPNQGATYITTGGATATELFTGDERVNLFATWRKPGQVALQQTNPFPLSVLAIVPEGLEGDTADLAYPAEPAMAQAAQRQSRGPGPWMLRR